MATARSSSIHKAFLLLSLFLFPVTTNAWQLASRPPTTAAAAAVPHQRQGREALPAATTSTIATTSRRSTALLAAGKGFGKKPPATSFTEQEANGFVPPPPAIAALVDQINEGGPTLVFENVLKAIDESYDFTPKKFVNGEVTNEAGTNGGSCKVLSAGILHGLPPATLLKLFGEHYRSVILTPTGSDHANIRNLLSKGWAGVHFPDGLALTIKKQK